ncbi:hypothetical protein FB45DRAFT_896041 [Roridomyces roridus]|uniref:Uncharacterized protein n=1 Tax=Roridomyces roridus TaxID=1738132 RepID=A0AAD7CAL9_9AGAR|nr:hypothetical protein FB45DRAFT_896041 [Roridomyces roridus]
MSSRSDVRLKLAQQFLLHLDQLLQSNPELLLHDSFPSPQLWDGSSHAERLRALGNCLQTPSRPAVDVDGDSIPGTHELAALDEVPPDDVPDADITFASTSTEEAREVVEMLVWHAEDSTDFDTQKLSAAKTLHEFFIAPHIMRPIEATGRVHKRHARETEVLRQEHRLTELAYVPDMAARLVKCRKKRENLAKVELSHEENLCMTAGAYLANSWKKIYYEADVERHFCVTQAHAVAEGINIVEGKEKDDQSRLFPHKGLPGHRREGQSSFSDVQIGKALTEMKTPFSITKWFETDLLGIKPEVLEKIIDGRTDHAFIFDYSPPSSISDDMGVFDQPVVQLFTQLYDKEFCFGQGSSHTYSFFVILDPKTPNRLYISPCIPAFPAEGEDEEQASQSGFYTMFHFVRIANDEDFADDFLTELRDSIKDKTVHVYNRDPERFAEKPAGHEARVDLHRGTVGVKYHDQPEAPADNLRRRTAKQNLAEDTTFDIDQKFTDDKLLPAFHPRSDKTSLIPRFVGGTQQSRAPDAQMAAAITQEGPRRTRSRGRAETESQQPPNAPAPSDQARLRREPSARRAATQVVQQPPVASTSSTASDGPTLRSRASGSSSSAQASSSIPKPGKGR